MELPHERWGRSLCLHVCAVHICCVAQPSHGSEVGGGQFSVSKLMIEQYFEVMSSTPYCAPRAGAYKSLRFVTRQGLHVTLCGTPHDDRYRQVPTFR